LPEYTQLGFLVRKKHLATLLEAGQSKRPKNHGVTSADMTRPTNFMISQKYSFAVNNLVYQLMVTP
jgi:hypothetical protein